MHAYIIRRLLFAIPTLFMVSIIVFSTVRLIPGSVVEMMVEEHGYAQNLDELEQELGLDKPILVQYGKWLWGLLNGDLGKSLWTSRPVIKEILIRFPVTLELALLAIFVSALIAIPVGVYSAVRQDTLGDYIARSIAIACITLPSFWVGTMVIVFPSVWWNWSPPMEFVSLFTDPLQNIKQFILPALILGMIASGGMMRMTRTTMLEVLRQDYIRTALAKGVKKRTIIFKHALKNSIIPVITMLGMLFPVMLGGSLIIEMIFNVPGMGRLTIEVLNSRDYPLLSGIVLFLSTLVVLTNIVVDICYAYFNPRIRYK